MDAHTLELLEWPRVRELVAGFAACSLGKRGAREMAPSTDEAAVRAALQATAEMTGLVAAGNGAPLGGLLDIAPQLDTIEAGTLPSAEDLSALASTLFCFSRCRAWADRLPTDPDVPALRGIAGRLGRFGDLSDELERIVDAEGRVKDDASQRLARIRTDTEKLKSDIVERIREYTLNATVRSYLQFPQATWSGDRYVLPVKADCRGRIPGIVHRTSASGETVFVEPSAVVEMGNAVQALISQEQQEITRILRELCRKIAGRMRELRRTLGVAGELDLLAAKAKFGLDYKAVRPEITADGTMRLRAARHPLLLHLFRKAEPPREVVPVDLRLGEDYDVLIVTGPNTGGKTVALKTTALLAVMAQAGLFVTAGHGARMPVFGGVFADVGDEQSLQQSLSTYSGHVKRIAEILSKADRRSLVMLDELGSGTDPAEGAALGRALLDELLRLGCKAIVTTHLGALKTYAYAADRAENASVEFDPVSLRPTYRLVVGEPGNSNALAIAERLGLNAGILFRARRYLAETDSAVSRMIDELKTHRMSAEAARRSAEESAAEAVKAKAEYEKRLAEAAGRKVQEENREAWRTGLQPGSKVFVPRFSSTGQFLRWAGAGKTEAVVQVGYMQVRMPPAQLLPPEEATA